MRENKLIAAGLADSCAVVALNFELPAGGLPEWIELIQPGMHLIGRDGRQWINDDPAAVVAALKARGADLPVDFEHATEIKAPQGDLAPAAGWCRNFEARDGGAIWAKVEWTPRGREAVANREYRYLSPVLLSEKGSGRIRSLSSIGLVNKPNLFNTALNHEIRGMKKIELSERELAICRQMGVSPEDYIATKAADIEAAVCRDLSDQEREAVKVKIMDMFGHSPEDVAKYSA